MARTIGLSIACLIDPDVAGQIRSGLGSNAQGSNVQGSNDRVSYDLSVIQALRRLYRRVDLVEAVEGSSRTMDELMRMKPDVVFNLACSTLPIEGSFTGCLEVLGIPYTGSGAVGIALANDKVRCRHLMRAAGVRVPRFVELVPGRPIEVDLTPPLIVKPVASAGCAGIHADSLARTEGEVARLARRIWHRFGTAALCDEFVLGREFRIGTIETRKGMRPIGITEWKFGDAAPGWGFKTQTIVNNLRVRRARRVSRALAILSRRDRHLLAETAQAAMAALDIRGYATMDARMDDMGRVSVLEVNSNPGLWSGSSIWSNPSFDRNIKRIVDAARRWPGD